MNYPRPARFSHVVFKTYDLPRLVAWYCDVLQCNVVLESPMVALLTYDDEHHRITITQLAGEPVEREERARGLHHIAYAFDSLHALLDHYRHMRSAEYRPAMTVHHGGTISLYYRDPDSNGVEAFCDRFPTVAATNEFLSSPSFRRNPVGYPFDPDEWIARLEKGETEEHLMEYEDIPLDPEFAASAGSF